MACFIAHTCAKLSTTSATPSNAFSVACSRLPRHAWHSLNVRPVVISDSSKVELQVESRSHNFLVAVDGRSYTMHEGTKVSIQKAPFSTMIVKPNGRKYFTSLREKMMWGVDKR